MQYYVAVKKKREKPFYTMIRENLQDAMLRKITGLKESVQEVNLSVKG